MLSPADADLVRRDPDIPALRLLLDPEAFAEALRRAAPEVEIEHAEATYVKYKRGMNCLVVYRVEIAGQPVLVHAKAWGVRRKPGIPGALLRGRLVLEDSGSTAIAFPSDAKVRGLAGLAEPPERARLLGELFPERPELVNASVALLAYKPERRYVGRLGGGEGEGEGEAGPAVVLKLYTEAGYEAASRAQPAPPLGRSDRYRALGFAWVSGRLLSDALAAHEVGPADLGAVGAALVRVHQRDARPLPSLPLEGQIARLFAEAETIATLLPGLRTWVHRLAGRLASRLKTTVAPPCAIHGDFHPRQVLMANGGVTFIDFDQGVRADPMIDLGVFAASLERSAIRGTIAPDRVEPLGDAVLAGYVGVGGRATPERLRLPERLQLQTAVELLRLAPRFFRYREPDWPERIAAALRRVETLACGLPGRGRVGAVKRLVPAT